MEKFLAMCIKTVDKLFSNYIRKLFEKHTGMYRYASSQKDVPVCFPGSQGSAGMPYRPILSNFEPWY